MPTLRYAGVALPAKPQGILVGATGFRVCDFHQRTQIANPRICGALFLVFPQCSADIFFWVRDTGTPQAPRVCRFEKPSSRSFWRCMGHGGVGGRPKHLFSCQRGPVRDFGPISLGFGFTSSPHPRVLRAMGPHTQSIINHPGSTSRKESVGCRLGSVEGGLVESQILTQILVSPTGFWFQKWSQNPGPVANQDQK